MIVLAPEAGESHLVAHRVVPVSDEYYAMMDSGTNVIIVPLRPDMSGEIAECKVRSAAVEGPIVQVLKYRDERRLVVALPQSAILMSQEWLTTVARWTLIAESKDGVSQIEVYTSETLSMKNGLPYLSKDLSGRLWKTLPVKLP